MGIFDRAQDRSAADVAGYLRGLVEGSGEEWDWDDFESIPIADPELERIRIEAVIAGPPAADFRKLRRLLEEAEALSRGAA